MGNELSAPIDINATAVGKNLQQVAQMGGRNRGRLLTALHCRVITDGSNPNNNNGGTNGAGGAQAGATGGAQGSQIGNPSGGPQQSPSAPQPQEVVVKVFIRSQKSQEEALNKCLQDLQSIQRRVEAIAVGRSSTSGGAGSSTARTARGATTVVAAPGSIAAMNAATPRQRPPLPHLASIVEPGGAGSGGGGLALTLGLSRKPTNLLYYSEFSVPAPTQALGVAYLQRPYVQYSLLERLHSRPFLGSKQRLFLGFQVLRAVEELHLRFGTPHGDLKAQNVLVTGTGWVYVVDIAPYKPVTLEATNPLTFAVYYDTMENRDCCLAPERLVDVAAGATIALDLPTNSGAAAAAPPSSTSTMQLSTVSYASEVFSAGCVLAQLLGDKCLFKFADVLTLRASPNVTTAIEFINNRLANAFVPLKYYELIQFTLLGITQRDLQEGTITWYSTATAMTEADKNASSPEREQGTSQRVNAADDRIPREEAEVSDECTQGTEGDGAGSPAMGSPSIRISTSPSAASSDLSNNTFSVGELPLLWEMRPTADEVIRCFTPTVFPPYFGFLHTNVLAALHTLTPELQVQYLWNRLDDCFDAAEQCATDPHFADAMASCPFVVPSSVGSSTAAGGAAQSSSATPPLSPLQQLQRQLSGLRWFELKSIALKTRGAVSPALGGPSRRTLADIRRELLQFVSSSTSFASSSSMPSEAITTGSSSTLDIAIRETLEEIKTVEAAHRRRKPTDGSHAAAGADGATTKGDQCESSEFRSPQTHGDHDAEFPRMESVVANDLLVANGGVSGAVLNSTTVVKSASFNHAVVAAYSSKESLRASFLEILAPAFFNAARRCQSDDALLKTSALLSRMAPHASDATRTDVLLPTAVHLAKRGWNTIPPVVRGQALRALGVIAESTTVLTDGEGALLQSYALPALFTVMRAAATVRNAMVLSASAPALTSVVEAALRLLDQRIAREFQSQRGGDAGGGNQGQYGLAAVPAADGYGSGTSSATAAAFASTISAFDEQRRDIVSSSWEALRGLLGHDIPTPVVVSALEALPRYVRAVGVETTLDNIVPHLSTLMGPLAVEIRRAVVVASIDIFEFVRHCTRPIATFIFSEAILSARDARTTITALRGVERLLEVGFFSPAQAIALAQPAVSLLTSPSVALSGAALHLLSTLPKHCSLADVSVGLRDACRTVLKPGVVLSELTAETLPFALLAANQSSGAASGGGSSGGGRSASAVGRVRVQGSAETVKSMANPKYFGAGPAPKMGSSSGGVGSSSANGPLMRLGCKDLSAHVGLVEVPISMMPPSVTAVAVAAAATATQRSQDASPSGSTDPVLLSPSLSPFSVASPVDSAPPLAIGGGAGQQDPAVEVVTAAPLTDSELPQSVTQPPPSVHWNFATFRPDDRQLARAKHRVAASRTNFDAMTAATTSASSSGGGEQKRSAKAKAGAATVTPSVGGASGGSSSNMVVQQHAPCRPIASLIASAPRAHDGAIRAMASCGHFIASASTDNVVKFWDLTDAFVPSRGVLRSQAYRDVTSGPCGSLAFCAFSNSWDPTEPLILGESSGGTLRFLNLTSGQTVHQLKLGSGEAGGLMSCCSAEDFSLAFVGSQRSGVFGVDLRVPAKEVWSTSLNNVGAGGPVSCMTLHGDIPYGLLCGTLRGHIALFDLRFRSAVWQYQVPGKHSAVYSMSRCASGGGAASLSSASPIASSGAGLVAPPSSSSSLSGTPSIAVATNTRDVIRLSLSPNQSASTETLRMRPATPDTIRLVMPLSATVSSSPSSSGSSLSSSSSVLVTAGTDRLIRLWDVVNPEHSCTLALPALSSTSGGAASATKPQPHHQPQPYHFNRALATVSETPDAEIAPMGRGGGGGHVGGSSTALDALIASAGGGGGASTSTPTTSTPSMGPFRVSATCHHADAITHMCIATTPPMMSATGTGVVTPSRHLVTASRDGAIHVWRNA